MTIFTRTSRHLLAASLAASLAAFPTLSCSSGDPAGDGESPDVGSDFDGGIGSDSGRSDATKGDSVVTTDAAAGDAAKIDSAIVDTGIGDTTPTETSTGVARPSYNTGKGFFVVDGKLYDANGVEFRIRGVNKLHWDSSSPGIPKTHANTERWVLDFKQPTTTNAKLMQQSIDDHLVPMPGNWDGTCKEDAAVLQGIVDTWVAQAAAFKPFERSMILNIANEWGPEGTVWRDSYITAIKRLRAAGYLATISVTAGGCGQSNDDLSKYASAVFESDPQKNVIFDQHIYGNWASTGVTWQIDLKKGLDALAATKLVVILGELGPGRGIGPSPTSMTPNEIISGAEARGFGWLAWAWDDPAFGADDTWFAMSKNGDYASSSDLTIFGKAVVEDPKVGLLLLGKPASIF